MHKINFLISAGIAMTGLVLATGCDRGGAATGSDSEMLQEPVRSGGSAVSRMAAELAIRRFFSANPESLDARVGDLKPFFKGVERDYGLDAAEDWVILEAAGSSKNFAGREVDTRNVAEAQTDTKRGAESVGFGVELVPERGSVFRGETARFKAIARGGEGVTKFQFGAVDGAEEEGVDEVPSFPDGGGNSPEYETTFGKVGVGKVVVRAFDSSGASARAAAAVVVGNKAPEMRVEEIPARVYRGQVVKPIVKTSDPEGDSVSVSLEVPGEARIEKDDALAFSFAGLGAQQIGLAAEDSYGGKCSTNVVVEVVNRSPTVTVEGGDAVAYPSIAFPLTVRSTDPDGDVVKTLVSYKENQIPEGKDGLYEVAFHEPGEHLVSVTATDNHGGEARTNVAIRVKNRPPVIQLAEGAITGTRGSRIVVAKGISDPDGDSVTAEGRGSSGKFETGVDGSVAVEFSELGNHSVKIVARDARGDESEKDVVVRVVNATPTVGLTVGPSKIHIGDTVEVDAIGADVDGDPLLFKFQSGNKESEASTSSRFTFVADTLGEGVVRVVVSDPEGGYAEVSKSYTVVAREPVVTVRPDRQTCSRLDAVVVRAEAVCPETGKPVSAFRAVEPKGEAGKDGSWIFRFGKLGTNSVKIEGVSEIGGVGIGMCEIMVTNLPPSLELSSEKRKIARGEVVPIKVDVRDEDGLGKTNSFKWDAGDGKVLSQKTGETSLVFPTVGGKKVIGTVDDGEGGVDSAELDFEVYNRAPTVELSVSKGPHYRNEVVAVKGVAKDEDEADGNPTTELYANGKLVPSGTDVKFDKIGKHEVKFVAKDALGAVSEKVAAIEVSNKVPDVKINSGGGVFRVGQDVRVEAVGMDEVPGVLSYRFEVGGVRLPPSDKPFADVSFSKKGKHTIRVTATDSDGGSSDDEATISVE